MSKGQHPPKGRKHGPKKKRAVYQEAIERVFRENDGWITAEQVSWKANEHISSFWTQLNCYSTAAILRMFVANGLIESHRPFATHPQKYKSKISKGCLKGNLIP